MATKINKYYGDLGFRQNNQVWSWGAMQGDKFLFTTWTDEYQHQQRRVIMLREPGGYVANESYGLDERIGHLEQLWSGGKTGYTVIADAENVAVQRRRIENFRDDVVYPILRLELTEEQSILAVLASPIKVEDFEDHAKAHRTEMGVGVFPIDNEQRTGASSNSYLEKVPRIRAWLIAVAKERRMVTYSDVMERYGLNFRTIRHAMDKLGHEARANGEPVITALIVGKNTGRCSQGIYDEFGIDDDQKERQRLYVYWASRTQVSQLPSAEEPPPAKSDFAARARRFALVEVRPYQREFRDAVFKACNGVCVISGCDVPEAVEAAHLRGRKWREGHNIASDGILLRRDLHALYDNDLMHFDEQGCVQLGEAIAEHYAAFAGVKVAFMPQLNEI